MSKLSLLPEEVETTIFSFICWREISPFVNHTFYRKYRKAAAQVIYRFCKKIYGKSIWGIYKKMHFSQKYYQRYPSFFRGKTIEIIQPLSRPIISSSTGHPRGRITGWYITGTINKIRFDLNQGMVLNLYNYRKIPLPLEDSYKPNPHSASYSPIGCEITLHRTQSCITRYRSLNILILCCGNHLCLQRAKHFPPPFSS